MKTYEFDIKLKEVSEVSDDPPTACAGGAWIHFDREATSGVSPTIVYSSTN